jgi:hypothetical protein
MTAEDAYVCSEVDRTIPDPDIFERLQTLWFLVMFDVITKLYKMLISVRDVHFTNELHSFTP